MKKNGKYICNRCGCVIDVEHDLDCEEYQMFKRRSISRVGGDRAGEKYHRVDEHTKLHFCGKCDRLLISYVYSHEFKKPPISEEIIRCRDCARFLRHDCPLSFLEKQRMCFIDMRSDFFCGYAERKDGEQE